MAYGISDKKCIHLIFFLYKYVKIKKKKKKKAKN